MRDSRLHRSSHLSAAALRALASVEFHPVGVVLGNSATHIPRPVALRAQGRVSVFRRSFRGDSGDEVPSEIRAAQVRGETAKGDPPYLASYPCPHRPLGERWSDHFPGYNWELPSPGSALTECFNSARARLSESALRHGAHGVVDIRMELTGDDLFQGNMQITLVGTAVSHPNAPPLKAPFTAGVSCQAFAKLLSAGLVPAQFAMGAAVLSSWAGCQSRFELESGYSRTVTQLGDAITQARDLSIGHLWQATELSDSPFVEVTVRHRHRRVSKADYWISSWASGTVAVQFDSAAASGAALPTVWMRQR